MDGALTTGPVGGRLLRMADYRGRTREAGTEKVGVDAHSASIQPIEPARNLTAPEVAHRERMLSHLAQVAGLAAR